MRHTSIKAYREIKEDGTLTRKQQEVYNYLKLGGPMTGRMVSKAIPGGHKRISELTEMGCVIGIETKKDPLTGKSVIYWQTTSNTPIKINKIRKENNALEGLNKMSEFYDRAFMDGVKMSIEVLFPNANYLTRQEMAIAIIERVQG